MASIFEATLSSMLEDEALARGDREHVQRWAGDERADEVWRAIEKAAHKHLAMPLPVGWFIRETLAARQLAQSINHRRQNRDRYRKRATQMKSIAIFLKETLPGGIPVIPFGFELARMLDEAARNYRSYVAVSENVPGQVRRTRESSPEQLFMSMMSNILRGMTGQWLDHEVAVLTEIALNVYDIEVAQVNWARQPRTRRSSGRSR
jgi:hypothetical protein